MIGCVHFVPIYMGHYCFKDSDGCLWRKCPIMWHLKKIVFCNIYLLEEGRDDIHAISSLRWYILFIDVYYVVPPLVSKKWHFILTPSRVKPPSAPHTEPVNEPFWERIPSSSTTTVHVFRRTIKLTTDKFSKTSQQQQQPRCISCQHFCFFSLRLHRQ